MKIATQFVMQENYNLGALKIDIVQGNKAFSYRGVRRGGR